MLTMLNPRRLLGCLEYLLPCGSSFKIHATGYAADVRNDGDSCLDVSLRADYSFFGRSAVETSTQVHICPGWVGVLSMGIANPDCYPTAHVRIAATAANVESNHCEFELHCSRCIISFDPECFDCSGIGPPLLQSHLGLRILAYRDRDTHQWVELPQGAQALEAPLGHEPDAIRVGYGLAYCHPVEMSIRIEDADFQPLIRIPSVGPIAVEFPPPFSGGVETPGIHTPLSNDPEIQHEGFLLFGPIRLSDGCLVADIPADFVKHMARRTSRGLLPQPFTARAQSYTANGQPGASVEILFRTRLPDVGVNAPVTGLLG